MTTSAAEVADLADPIWTVLEAISNLNAYDGEIVDDNGAPIDPPLDDDKRVHAYAVYYPGGGFAHAQLACGGTDSLDWTFQITCAGGDRTRALWSVNKVRAALSGQRVTVNGQDLLIREQGDPGFVRRDAQVQPTRFYLPLTFAVNA